MGLIDRLFNRKKSVLLGMPRVQFVGGKLVPVGDDLESNITEGYEAIGVVYSIIKIMTNKAGAIPSYLYKGSLKQQKDLVKAKEWSPQLNVKRRLATLQMQEVEEHPFLTLMKKPNGWQSGTEFKKQVLGYRLITGNAYIRKNCGQMPGVDPGNAKPVELQILPAQHIDIMADIANPWVVTGYKLNGGGYQQVFHPNEIIHFKYPNYSWDGGSLDHLYGMSPLKALTMDLTAAKYMKQAQASQAQNEGAKGMIVRNDDYEMTEEQRDLIQERVDQEMNRAVNRGRNVVTNANVRWEQMGLSASEMDLVKTFQLGKEDICNAYNGFPIHLISSATSTFNNVEAAVKFLTTNCVWPEISDYDEMVNNEVLKKYWGEDYMCMHDISDLPELASDYNTMAQSLKDLWWLTPNEKRWVMKWASHADKQMDEIIVPSGYVPLDRVFEDPFAMPTNTNVSNDYNNGSKPTSA